MGVMFVVPSMGLTLYLGGDLLGDATTISSSMIALSGLRSGGIVNRAKKDVIFWLPDVSFFCSGMALFAALKQQQCSAGTA